MSEQQDKSNSNEGQTIQANIPPDLDYLFRDIANVFVGVGEVVIEFGNYHRSTPGHASISNRIVLTVSTAYELQNNLSQALAAAQKRLQENSNPDT